MASDFIPIVCPNCGHRFNQFEQRKSVQIGPYTVHAWPLDPHNDPRRQAWIEGTTIDGRRAPVTSCFTFDDAVRTAKKKCHP